MGFLIAENISYRYGKGSLVFNDLSMTFEVGQIYALLGESGAGKTTLLSLLAGLDICQSGSILFKHLNLKKINRDRYRAKNVGLIFQQYNLLHRYNAIENILVGMEISRFNVKNKNKEEYARELLESLGINKDQCRRKVIELSGGEQQRVAVARAISHQHDIILADEPTSSLDDGNQTSIMESLAKFARIDGRCVIVSTHSKAVADYADEVVAIKKNQM